MYGVVAQGYDAFWVFGVVCAGPLVHCNKRGLLECLPLGYCVYSLFFRVFVCVLATLFMLFSDALLILICGLVLLVILDVDDWNRVREFAGLGFNCFTFAVFAVRCCLILGVLIGWVCDLVRWLLCWVVGDLYGTCFLYLTLLVVMGF